MVVFFHGVDWIIDRLQPFYEKSIYEWFPISFQLFVLTCIQNIGAWMMTIAKFSYFDVIRKRPNCISSLSLCHKVLFYLSIRSIVCKIHRFPFTQGRYWMVWNIFMTGMLYTGENLLQFFSPFLLRRDFCYCTTFYHIWSYRGDPLHMLCMENWGSAAHLPVGPTWGWGYLGLEDLDVPYLCTKNWGPPDHTYLLMNRPQVQQLYFWKTKSIQWSSPFWWVQTCGTGVTQGCPWVGGPLGLIIRWAHDQANTKKIREAFFKSFYSQKGWRWTMQNLQLFWTKIAS